jgi:hypothetical protein
MYKLKALHCKHKILGLERLIPTGSACIQENPVTVSLNIVYYRKRQKNLMIKYYHRTVKFSLKEPYWYRNVLFYQDVFIMYHV